MTPTTPTPALATYRVEPNYCDCHVETCCCDPYVVVGPDGAKPFTQGSKKKAEEIAALLNELALARRAAQPAEGAGQAGQMAMSRDEISRLIEHTADTEGFDTTTAEGVDALIHAVVSKAIERAAAPAELPETLPPDAAEYLQDRLHSPRCNANSVWKTLRSMIATHQPSAQVKP